jgi:hypothetical protein
MQGKVFVKGSKLRNEIIGVDGKQVTILRNDVGIIWILASEQKSYMEFLTVGATENALTMNPYEIEKAAEKRYLGKERVNGYDCEKYLYTYHDESLGTVTRWFSESLHFRLKMEIKGPFGTVTTEYKNISEKRLSDSLFEIPKDYTRVQLFGIGTSDQF